MTLFYLVRHALTPYTNRRLSGRMPGIHLNDKGREQARAVAAALREVPFAAIYSSPLERTIETARAIAKDRGLRVQTRSDLGEVDYGDWTDRPLKVLARTKLWTQVQRFPSAARFPSGETLSEVQARSVAALEKLRAAHPKEAICVVSHGDVIRLLLAHYLGVHIDLFQRIHVGPASLSTIAVSDHGPYVLSMNVPASPS